MLYIVGLGPGAADMVTPRALRVLESCPRVLLRTERIACAAQLAERTAFESLDALYEAAEDFDSLCEAIAARVCDCAKEGDVAYAVSDVAEATVGAVLRRARALGEDALEIVPGVPACGAATAGLAGEFCLIDAANWENAQIDPRLPLVVRELDTRLLAGELKVRLLDRYPADARVTFFASSVDGTQRHYEIALEQLDRQPKYDHTVCARVEAVTLAELSERVMSSEGDTQFDFGHLVEVVRTLRAPGGCPWDREQTHESLRRTLIEECYEVNECIDAGDWEHLYDELGDVLLQVVMHAQIASEYGEFTLDDVTRAICRKMIFRHSHIFGSDTAADAREVLKLWEERKKQEKGQRTTAEAMAGVTRGLPALMRADKVQAKAARQGFGWEEPLGALGKVREELDELARALSGQGDVCEELGDLLFACVSVAQLCGQDAEQALSAATDKFVDRFTRMERAILDDGKRLPDMTQVERDEYWDKIKH